MMVRRAVTMWGGIVVLAIMGLAGTAAAQGNIQLGPFRILTSLETALEYDDNILLTANNKIDDLIWIISPGILIEIPAKQYSLRERYSFDANFRWFLVRYDDRQFQNNDRDDYTVTGTFFYRILPKTSILGSIDYVWVRYDQAVSSNLKDNEGLRFWLGVKGDLTAKTTVLVKGGWEWKYYDNPIQRDWDGLIVEGNIIWKYRDPSEVRLFGGRANVESTFQGQPYYVTNYGGAEVRHYIGERLILRVRGLGGFNDYPYDTITATKVAKRTDTFIEVGASIRYQMKKWLAFELGYTFLDLNSNFDEFDYTDNRVKASVILTY